DRYCPRCHVGAPRYRRRGRRPIRPWTRAELPPGQRQQRAETTREPRPARSEPLQRSNGNRVGAPSRAHRARFLAIRRQRARRFADCTKASEKASQASPEVDDARRKTDAWMLCGYLAKNTRNAKIQLMRCERRKVLIHAPIPFVSSPVTCPIASSVPRVIRS